MPTKLNLLSTDRSYANHLTHIQWGLSIIFVFTQITLPISMGFVNDLCRLPEELVLVYNYN
jgi:hypothetical protein